MHRRRIFTYAEEADDDTNKVSQRKRSDIYCLTKDVPILQAAIT
jgi:hypothetical protein